MREPTFGQQVIVWAMIVFAAIGILFVAFQAGRVAGLWESRADKLERSVEWYEVESKKWYSAYLMEKGENEKCQNVLKGLGFDPKL